VELNATMEFNAAVEPLIPILTISIWLLGCACLCLLDLSILKRVTMLGLFSCLLVGPGGGRPDKTLWSMGKLFFSLPYVFTIGCYSIARDNVRRLVRYVGRDKDE
jgi:hypothetical protein